ncbi:hypothetical protein [Noviherbaspirillum pedocola]|uniref:Uncharacterized protein n=1 Tax=Noviherbaspirillum pedocola TaxID=2801341 RepID=A0A934SZQ3_9BURK|nr:hypothetical protein [Noviherbaspirillum pedocola]MBK4737991.1 hypothetical protein [Noviherbaspirillum pedocola]
MSVSRNWGSSVFDPAEGCQGFRAEERHSCLAATKASLTPDDSCAAAALQAGMPGINFYPGHFFNDGHQGFSVKVEVGKRNRHSRGASTVVSAGCFWS